MTTYVLPTAGAGSLPPNFTVSVVAVLAKMVLVEPAPVPERILTVHPARPLTGQDALLSVRTSSAHTSGLPAAWDVPATKPVTVEAPPPAGVARCGSWQSAHSTCRFAPESVPSAAAFPSAPGLCAAEATPI